MDSDSGYSVVAVDDGFDVVSPTGLKVLGCRDEHSASHYAVLLTNAWRSGFREGYRSAAGEQD